MLNFEWRYEIVLRQTYLFGVAAQRIVFPPSSRVSCTCKMGGLLLYRCQFSMSADERLGTCSCSCSTSGPEGAGSRSRTFPTGDGISCPCGARKGRQLAIGGIDGAVGIMGILVSLHNGRLSMICITCHDGSNPFGIQLADLFQTLSHNSTFRFLEAVQRGGHVIVADLQAGEAAFDSLDDCRPVPSDRI